MGPGGVEESHGGWEVVGRPHLWAPIEVSAMGYMWGG